MTVTRVYQHEGAREALDIKTDEIRGTITLSRSNEVVGECIVDGVKYPSYEAMLDDKQSDPQFVIVE